MSQAPNGNPTPYQGRTLEPDDLLLTLADSEAHEIRDDLAKIMPADVPVTFLLYQPVLKEEVGLPEGCRERFVEVGPLPTGALAGPVYQAVSGASGSYLLDDNSAKKFMPLPAYIDAEIVASYIGAGPTKWRLRQVAVEKLRYRQLVSEWGPDDAPPIGKWMYQVPFVPFPTNSESIERHPNLGLIYTLNEIPDGYSRVDSSSTDKDIVARATIWKLLSRACTAGNIALRHRFTALFGEDRVTRLLKLAAKSIAAGEGDDCHIVASMLLSHHWFFGYDAAAYRLICHLIRERLNLFENQLTDKRLRECIKEVYECHSICPHSHEGEQRDATMLLTTLQKDCFSMLSYSAQIFAPTAEFTASTKSLLSPLCTMLTLMCGGIYGMTGSLGTRRLHPIRTKEEWNKVKYICIAHPNLALTGTDLRLPVYQRAALADNLGRGNAEERPISFLGPGETEKSYGRAKGTRPDYWIKNIAPDGESMRASLQDWPEDDDGKTWERWLRDFVRYRIAQELTRLDRNDDN